MGAGAQDVQSCLRDQGSETGTATRLGWFFFFFFERSEGELSKERCESLSM